MTSGGELHVELGYRVNEVVAVGAHAGVTFGTTWTDRFYNSSTQMIEEKERSVHPLELGASLQLFPSDRFWLAPWVGMMHSSRETATTRLTIGASLGFDLLTGASEHHVGIYVRGLQTSGYADEDGIRAFMIGGSYGYR